MDGLDIQPLRRNTDWPAIRECCGQVGACTDAGACANRVHSARKPARWYLAGPMTGYPDLNFPAFHAAAASLRALGLHVVNPAELNPDPGADWKDCMRTDIAELVHCDGIVLLPGWEGSKGAKLERHIAEAFGLIILKL